MLTEKELQLLIQITKNRKKLDTLETIVEESFFILIKELDSQFNIVDKSFSVDTV